MEKKLKQLGASPMLIASVLNLHCPRLATRTQHSGWNTSAIRTPVEDNLSGSVHGNFCGTEQGMEDVLANTSNSVPCASICIPQP